MSGVTPAAAPIYRSPASKKGFSPLSSILLAGVARPKRNAARSPKPVAGRRQPDVTLFLISFHMSESKRICETLLLLNVQLSLHITFVELSFRVKKSEKYQIFLPEKVRFIIVFPRSMRFVLQDNSSWQTLSHHDLASMLVGVCDTLCHCMVPVGKLQFTG